MTVQTMNERPGIHRAEAGMTAEERELWERISAFELDEEDSRYPFTAKLARENGWSLRYARRAVAEYRKFVFMAMSAGHMVCPSEAVDQVWHLHLTYTESYWHRFCRETLGRPLHHHPSKGGSEQQQKHVAMYERTLETYRRYFGEPPADIWPDGKQRFGADTHHRRINEHDVWVIPKRPLKRAGVMALIVAVTAPVIGFGAIESDRFLNPFDFRGPEFLAFFVGMSFAGMAIAGVLRWLRSGPHDDPPRSMPDLHPYEIAYLSGGEVAAANTAMAAMVERGNLELLPAERAVRLLNPVPTDAHPLEQAVQNNIPMGKKALVDLRPGLRKTIDSMAERLQSYGLTPTPSQARRAMIVPLLVALIAPALGVMKIMVGLSRGRPVAFLVIGCVVITILALAFFARPVRLSGRGRRALIQLQARHASLRRYKEETTPGMAGGDVAMAMALFGFAAFAGSSHADMRKALNPPQGSSGCGGGCGTSSSSSDGGGGGDGGGGCGGGGCGGCGGGD